MAEGVSVGVTVAAGTAVGLAEPPPDGTAVGAAVGGADTGVAVADDPQAIITASRSAKGPRMIAFGCFNQLYKAD
ncbi:MAG: hypothetical protein BZY83_04050 [SAR202 cluster bacterium Casp-Chloro-G2]|nr:MAG: hypothetical protein BZY83_04050 [SAR202 cluster bacterium Casp-Chloro-G2]